MRSLATLIRALRSKRVCRGGGWVWSSGLSIFFGVEELCIGDLNWSSGLSIWANKQKGDLSEKFGYCH